MNVGFYPRLAWDSIRKNSRMYLPYWITCTMCICMFYLMISLSENPTINHMRGGSSTTMILELGCIVIAVFSVCFLFYTNAFLIRRRKKEFGLYSVLGMNRSDIGRVLLWETLTTAGITLAAGLIIGILVSKLGELLLIRLAGESARTGFYISLPGILWALILFGLIFLLLLLNGIRQVRFSSITELLKSTQSGEKPPKANYVLAVLAIIMLGIAYWMAITIQQPLTALILFFFAVILVIIGSYLLMISGSVAMCRFLQSRKRYYYRTNHFVSVSSMAYRMKRNGAGLASICILATMVLVMISSTACLYFGSADVLNQRYPRDINIEASFRSHEKIDDTTQALREMISTTLADEGISPANIKESKLATISGMMDGMHVVLDEKRINLSSPVIYDKVVTLCFIDAEEYNRTAEHPLTIPENTLLVYSPRYEVGEGTLYLDDQAYEVSKAPENVIFHYTEENAIPTVYLLTADFVGDTSRLMKYCDSQGDPWLSIMWNYSFDTHATTDRQIALRRSLTEAYGFFNKPDCLKKCLFNAKIEEHADYYGSFGGFFFLGLLLSAVFLAAASVIIYYKQMSEGYEDRERFDILQKVGMTKKDIRESINTQMRTVFFFPLGIAVMHLCFAFPMIRKMLLLFGLNNLPLLLGSAAVSTLIFAAFYVIVYRVTAGIYYRLVACGNTYR